MLDNRKPLTGLKVIDFTRVFAGPYCTMLLADLGADVVKVELPGTGDPLRTQGPPFHHGLGVTFLAANRNKRSLTLDMGTDAGKDVAYRLCRGADVLVENFRPDVMPRLGLGYDRLSAINPKLVYASISGMGADGPDKDIGAFDLTIQAIGGYMSITGERGGRPIKLGTSAFDMIAGMNCQTAILAALLQRATTGAGQKVETPPYLRIARGLARTFQTPRFDPLVTVEEAVLCGFYPVSRTGILGALFRSRAVAKEERDYLVACDRLLEHFRLDGVRDVLLGELPMGQVRLVEVARAIANQPKYLLLDEPAAGLTKPEQAMLSSEIRRLAEAGVGILLVEHNFGLVRELSDHAVVLDRGAMLIEGRPDVLMTDPRFVEAYLGASHQDHAKEAAQ